MTPDQLNEIEARAKAESYVVARIRNDTLALVAAYRELEQHLKQSDERFQNSCKQVDDQFGQKMEQMGRAEKAEARVKELEAEVDRVDASRMRLAEESVARAGRVTVLREALEMLMGACDGLDPSKCACCCTTQETARDGLATLDPAAAALTERLKAAEAVCEAADKEHQSGWPQHDRYACDVCISVHAWRNEKERT